MHFRIIVSFIFSKSNVDIAASFSMFYNYRTTITVSYFLQTIHQEVIMEAEEEAQLMVACETLKEMEATELQVITIHHQEIEISVSWGKACFYSEKVSNKVLYNHIHHFDRGRTSRPIPSILRPPGRDRDSYYDDQDFDELSPTTTLTPSDAAKPLSLLPQVSINSLISFCHLLS